MSATETELRQTVDIKADASIVWELLTDATQIPRWMGRSIEADPRPGGVFRGEINDWARFSGSFVELVPQEKVVFTFGWENADPAPGSSTVTITLEPLADGTRVTLVHSGLSEATRTQHEHGWGHYLARLASVGGGGEPGPDPMESAPRPTA
jgi:uncharacterized protein YndB with AHSA1/START domain